jgi:predicted nucleic acid-binding protein
MSDTFVVIDASVAIKAILPNPLQRECLALIQTFADAQPAAPALWAYETTSAISKALHFGYIQETEARLALSQLEALNIRLFVADAEQNRSAFEWTRQLKRASAYDSYYLVLAQDLQCNFWTADKRLFNALREARADWLHSIEELSSS